MLLVLVLGMLEVLVVLVVLKELVVFVTNFGYVLGERGIMLCMTLK